MVELASADHHGMGLGWGGRVGFGWPPWDGQVGEDESASVDRRCVLNCDMAYASHCVRMCVSAVQVQK